MGSRKNVLGALLALLILAAACGDSNAEEQAAEAAANSRLIVIDENGDLVTMRADGTDQVVLAEDGGTVLTFLQPTWSPDRSRVAWTEVNSSESPPTFHLVTSMIDGSAQTRASIDYPPFYLLWDPTSARIAYLGTGSTGLEMGLVDVAAQEEEGTTLDGGAPYYLSWAPDGQRLVVHVESRRLDFLDLDGGRTPIGAAPGLFNAPIWSVDGSSLVYAAAEADGQRIVVSDGDGTNGKDVVRFEGFVSFLLNPQGDRIAFQPGGASAQSPGLTALGPRPPGPALGAVAGLRAQGELPTASMGLSVIDLDSGEVTQLSEDPVAAYFWSPDGARLLVMELDLEGDQPWFRWTVWEDELVFTSSRFFPSATLLRNYLPFFDQYAQSLSLWSPDGTAYTFAGLIEGGESGIWVQQVEEGADPVLVGDGVFASWSP